MEYIEKIGEATYKMQVRRINIKTSEIENIGGIREADYVVYPISDDGAVEFGIYGIADHVTANLKNEPIYKVTD